jgi:hypothetical protein
MKAHLAAMVRRKRAASRPPFNEEGDCESPRKSATLAFGIARRHAPQNTFAIAQFLRRVGAIKNKPKSWRDYFFVDAATAQGH